MNQVLEQTRDRLDRFKVTRYSLAVRPTDTREQVDTAVEVVRAHDSRPGVVIEVVAWTPGDAA